METAFSIARFRQKARGQTEFFAQKNQWISGWPAKNKNKPESLGKSWRRRRDAFGEREIFLV
jgi:hypothetical protein